MTFLPIVDRELREASRRPSTYWIRVSATLAAIALGLWVTFTMFGNNTGMAAKQVFATVSGALLVGCLFSGLRGTADCISREKRDGTLGLLFLTDLRGMDVVLGKLAATSLNLIYAVLASLPVVAIPLLMGGVSGPEMARISIVILVTLFFSLSVGLLVSTLNRDARKAIGATCLLLILIAGALPLTGLVMEETTRFRGLGRFLYLFSPFHAFGMAFDSAYRGQPHAFATSLSIIAAMGLAALGLACWVVPNCWQDRSGKRNRLGIGEWLHKLDFGEGPRRSQLRQELLDVNPFLWLSSRSTLRSKAIWAVLALLGIGWIWGYAKFKRDWLNEGIFIATAFTLHALLKGWVATEASRSLAEQREQGTLELLLSTPLSVPEILKGQALALQRTFLGPFVLIVVLDIIMAFGGISRITSSEEREMISWLWIAGMIMLPADLVALYWVGLWQGLISDTPQRASTRATLFILVLPWIIFAVLLMFHAISGWGSGGRIVFYTLTSYWFFGSMIVNFVFASYSRRRLLEDFREFATQRFAKVSWWKQLLKSQPALTPR